MESGTRELDELPSYTFLMNVRAAIQRGHLASLESVLSTKAGWTLLNWPLNELGDCALGLCLRCRHFELVEPLLSAGCGLNVVNGKQETPLDILLSDIVLPADDSLSPSPVVDVDNGEDERRRLELVKTLLGAGALTRHLPKLVLFGLERDVMWFRAICESLSDGQLLANDEYYHRYTKPTLALLLQIAAWFNYFDLVEVLFTKGVYGDIYFWNPLGKFPELATIPWIRDLQLVRRRREVGGAGYTKRTPAADCPPREGGGMRGRRSWGGGGSFIYMDEGRVELYPLPPADRLLDWREEWCDEERDNQLRVRPGMYMPAEMMTLIVRSANTKSSLDWIAYKAFHYLGHSYYEGDIKRAEVLIFMSRAGYGFDEKQLDHLHGREKWSGELAELRRAQAVVQTLRQLCRLAVRFSFYTNVFRALDKLTCLPKTLKDYLSLKMEL